MLDRIQHEQTLDVYGHVTCLRAQRNYMVQTEDQYVFIYDALLDAVESGNTEVPADSLYLHVQHLTTLYVADDPRQTAMTGMEIEFKVCVLAQNYQIALIFSFVFWYSLATRTISKF